MKLDLEWRRIGSDLHPGVSYEVRPLMVWAYLDLLAAWEVGSPARPGEVTEESPPSPALSSQIWRVLERVFPEHLRALEGLVFSSPEGETPPSPADIAREAVMIPLAGEILGHLMRISQVGEAEAKN